MHPDDPAPKLSQEMIWHGTEELKASNLLRPELYADPARLMIAVGRIYSAMRRREKMELPTKEIFLIGDRRA